MSTENMSVNTFTIEEKFDDEMLVDLPFMEASTSAMGMQSQIQPVQPMQPMQQQVAQPTLTPSRGMINPAILPRQGSADVFIDGAVAPQPALAQPIIQTVTIAPAVQSAPQIQPVQMPQIQPVQTIQPAQPVQPVQPAMQQPLSQPLSQPAEHSAQADVTRPFQHSQVAETIQPVQSAHSANQDAFSQIQISADDVVDLKGFDDAFGVPQSLHEPISQQLSSPVPETIQPVQPMQAQAISPVQPLQPMQSIQPDVIQPVQNVQPETIQPVQKIQLDAIQPVHVAPVQTIQLAPEQAAPSIDEIEPIAVENLVALNLDGIMERNEEERKAEEARKKEASAIPASTLEITQEEGSMQAPMPEPIQITPVQPLQPAQTVAEPVAQQAEPIQITPVQSLSATQAPVEPVVQQAEPIQITPVQPLQSAQGVAEPAVQQEAQIAPVQSEPASTDTQPVPQPAMQEEPHQITAIEDIRPTTVEQPEPAPKAMSPAEITEKEFLQKLSAKINIPFIDLEDAEIDQSAIKFVSEKIARDHHVVPIAVHGNNITVAMADATDFQAVDDIKITSGKRVIPVLATSQAINTILNKYYTNTDMISETLQEFEEQDLLDDTPVFDAAAADIENAPIVRAINSILMDSVNMKASDIHIEPFEKEIRVRIRIDGDLKTLVTMPKSALSGVVTRVKIMADLNIAENKIPQDGRVRMNLDGIQVNMRISILPTVYGEKIVIRILNKDAGVMDKSEIGLTPYNFSQVEKLVKISEGIVLLTGPTGSGKTTTLYSILKDFNTINRNIITLEDPVEFSMAGINQVQVNVQTGMTFASGLRSVLRQDPDVVMLGEIRDEETAEIAIRAAVTGHVVLSTLHTNDTASTITRLTDMHIPRYMVTTALAGVVAQRLLKANCPKCSVEYDATDEEKEILGVTGELKLRKGVGCTNCNGSGYKGRIGIHEVFVLDKDIKALINSGGTADEIKDLACEKGMQTLADTAREKVLEGVTTIEQMMKATYSLE